MYELKLCAPALIYIIFSLIQIILDIKYELYNTALIKIFVAVIITCLLNYLCINGMGVVSWIIVFIPFIFMSFIIAILLYVFGLNSSNGKIIYSTKNKNKNINQPPQPPPLLLSSDYQFQ